MEMLTDLQHHHSHSRSINSLCKCLASEMSSSSHLAGSGYLTKDYFRNKIVADICLCTPAGVLGAYPAYSPVPDTMH